MYIECVPGLIYDVRSDYRSQWVINEPLETFDIKL